MGRDGLVGGVNKLARMFWGGVLWLPAQVDAGLEMVWELCACLLGGDTRINLVGRMLVTWAL